jgi:aspartate aminotransferase-like enzyme
MISFGARAWRAYETARMGRFYFDLGDARRAGARCETPSTPGLPAYYGLHASLKKMVAEGPAAIYAGTSASRPTAGQGCKNWDSACSATEGYRSNTVTAATLGERGPRRKGLERFAHTRTTSSPAPPDAPGVEMIRVGHLGYVSEGGYGRGLCSAARDPGRVRLSGSRIGYRVPERVGRPGTRCLSGSEDEAS